MNSISSPRPSGLSARKLLHDAARPGGFALVIVLALIAVMVVLVVYFAMMTQVEAQTASSTARHLEARQNALLGMEVAIGQLQRYAGKDQAVSFPATTYYPEKNVVEGTGALIDGDSSADFPQGYRDFAQTSSDLSYLDSVGTYLTPTEREDFEDAIREFWNSSSSRRNPHWTGIMDSSLRVDRFSDPTSPTDLTAAVYEDDPDTLYGEPDREQLALWLVSGNEKFHDTSIFDPASDANYPTGYFTPDSDLVAQINANPNIPIASGLSAEDYVVTLVGDGSASDENTAADGLDGTVEVAKQPLEEQDGNGDSTVVGHYAYWVADESVKANFAVRDPYFTSAVNTQEYRNRLQVPQRIGWENIVGFDDATFGENDERLEYVNSSNEISLLENSNTEEIEQASKDNFHALTAFSRSLHTNTARGGLKKDLTRYLEDGPGGDVSIGNTDPIADPDLYDNDDPRLGAYGNLGGLPQGFPNSINQIPTWGQLRSWYQNDASGGTISPDADTAPVLTYVMFHSGLSYDGSTQTVRWHWLPCIGIWNPYDTALSSATYELEVAISPDIWHFYIVKEAPSLAELQQDTEADWQEITANSDGAVNGPDGNPVLGYDGQPIAVSSGDRLRIFRGRHVAVDNGQTNRYFRMLDTNPNETNMASGPWVYDTEDGLENGTTDAFGRFHYAWEVVDPDTLHQGGYQIRNGWPSSADNARDALANKQMRDRIRPIEKDINLPIDHPFRFRFTSSFAPGEAKLFTVRNSQQWDRTSTDAVTLENYFDPDFPGSLYYDALTLTNGPASAGDDIKFQFNQINQTKAAPKVHFTIGGNTIMQAEEQLGSIGYNNMMGVILGSNYQQINDGWTERNPPGPNDVPNPNNRFVNKDDDGDGVQNRNEDVPKFVNAWRNIYDFSDFENNYVTLDPYATESSIFPYGVTWIQPLTGQGTPSGGDTHTNLAAFSRFNLGAESYDRHPLVDGERSQYGENNSNYQGLLEGLSRLEYIKSRDNTGQAWDDNQANGDSGFALITYQNISQEPSWDSDAYQGITYLPIRNARRAGSEILSLGQLQQVNLSDYFWQPTFPIANSDANPYVDREAIAGINSRMVGSSTNVSNTGFGKIPNDAENQLLDLSYLLNEAIWDDYFLSSIPSGGISLDTIEPLPNSRHRIRAESGPTISDLQNFETAAAHLWNTGALNVNSTSKEAWKALLTAFRDLEIQAQTNERNPDETVPVSRSLDPIESPVDYVFNGEPGNFDVGSREGADYGNLSTLRDYSKIVGGFRYLTDDMIEELAASIVNEIRLRGPFLSMADFVNRRLVAPDGSNEPGSDWYEARTNGYVGPGENQTPSKSTPGHREDNNNDYMNPAYDPFPGLAGLNGPLQRAINVSGINGGVNNPRHEREDRVFTVRIKDDGDEDSANNSHTNNGIGGRSNRDLHHSIDPAVRSHIDSEHLAGAPLGEAGQLFSGAPGFVTQGDLLAMIGPALTARGDTFLIRSYGDVVNPATGEVESQVWLEAVVQRIPDPVAPAGTSGADQWRPTDRFGRQFEVVNFRWLAPDEI